MKKQFLFVLCICLMAVAVLSACSKNASAPSDSQNTVTSAEVDTAEDTKELKPTQRPF